MKKLLFWGLMLVFLSGCNALISTPKKLSVNSNNQTGNQKSAGPSPSVPQTAAPRISAWENIPLKSATARITKKPFGIKVSPQTSPVKPERFSGYHTGVDYEITDNELNLDVPISAICDGEILQKRTAQGYGGILVQSCQLNNQDVSVVYGHLKLTSIQLNKGDKLQTGENFAVLGDAYSNETGGERKHLHLGIHIGKNINISGYVQKAEDLNNWLDFEKIRPNLQ
jgi:hypothetical protein